MSADDICFSITERTENNLYRARQIVDLFCDITAQMPEDKSVVLKASAVGCLFDALRDLMPQSEDLHYRSAATREDAP